MSTRSFLLLSGAFPLLVTCGGGGGAGTADTQESASLSGTVESSFAIDINGQSHRGQAIALQNGKVIVCGQVQTLTGTDSFVLRLDSEYALDQSFGTNGITVFSASSKNDGVLAVSEDGDARLVVAGFADDEGGNRKVMLGRLTPDGVLDTTFGTGGILTMQIGETTKDTNMNREIAFYGLALPEGDDRIVAAGAAISGSQPTMFVAQFLEASLDPSFGEDGIVWAQFESGAKSGVKTLAIASSGEIVAAGWAVLPSQVSAVGTEAVFWVLEPDGQEKVLLSFDFGNGGWDDIYGAACDKDGKVIVVGSSSDPGGSLRYYAGARLTLQGEFDSSFGTGGKAVFDHDSEKREEWKSVAVGSEGEYYAVGTSRISGEESYISVACLDVDGTLRTSFGSSGLVNISIGARPSAGYGCRLEAGKLYVVGTVGQETSNPDIGVAVVR